MPHYRLHQDPKSSHQQIAQLLKELRPALTLDVGAAQGFLGQLLSGSNLMLDAIEPDVACAEQAKPFYRQVWASPVEKVDMAPGTYDAVVLADVLEHTVDPVAVLRQLRQWARKDAWFIVSVPNVTHLAVRLMLLAGYFPKMDRGILDRTHLHFFTRDTARALLRQAGLQVHRVSATGVPLEELAKGRLPQGVMGALSSLQQVAVSIVPRLMGFQWIMLARASGQ